MKNLKDVNSVQFKTNDESLQINAKTINRGEIEILNNLEQLDDTKEVAVKQETLSIAPKYVSYNELRKPQEEKPKFFKMLSEKLKGKDRKESPERKDKINISD